MVQTFKKFVEEESAVGVVDFFVVLIGLVVIFRDQLTSIVNTIFSRIAADSAAI